MKLSFPVLALVSASFILPQVSFAETEGYAGFQEWLSTYDQAFKERLQKKYRLFLKQQKERRDKLRISRLDRDTRRAQPLQEVDQAVAENRRRESETRIQGGTTKHRFRIRPWKGWHTTDFWKGKTAPGPRRIPGKNEVVRVPKANDAIPYRTLRDQQGETPASVGNGQPSNDARDAFAETFLDAINTARSSSRACGNRTYSAAPPITWNEQLAVAASKHANEMARYNYFSHTGTDGLSVGDRVKAQGYRWRAVGENIAAGRPTIEATVDDWLQSPGHCANIMNPAFSEMGAARAEDGGADYGVYWTLVLANR